MWAVGSKRRWQTELAPMTARAQFGVTLLELLVVVAVMALATAGVALAIRAGPAVQLAREAERLVALLEAGRAASRASAVPVRWILMPEGFRFEGVAPQSLPDRWLEAGVVVQPAVAVSLVLGPEPVIGAQQLTLTHVDAPGQSLRIYTDGLRPFAVQ